MFLLQVDKKCKMQGNQDKTPSTVDVQTEYKNMPVKFFLAVQTDPKAHPGPERAADHEPPSNAGFRMG